MVRKVIALWVKSKMADFAECLIVKLYNSRHNHDNRGIFMFSGSNMGFSGMPNTVVLLEYALDIAFRMKNPTTRSNNKLIYILD